MYPKTAAIAATVAAALASGSAAAQGVCVECRGPDQTYRCTIKDGDNVHNIRGAGRATEYICMTELARAGSHQSCRVTTSYSGPCIGIAQEIDLAKLTPPAAPAAGQSAPDGQGQGQPQGQAKGQAPDGQPAPAAKPAKSGPPKTLEELARDTVSKSKEQISAADETMRKAGGAVEGTLKKTWDCVASLFSRC
jgi:hypothetical protein